MLHPAHHLLADKATLVEGDAVEIVHVRVVGKGISGLKVMRGLGQGKGDPARMVGAVVAAVLGQ